MLRKAFFVAALASGVTLLASIAGLASAVVTVTQEPSPIAGCDNGSQPGKNFPSAEVEPQLAVFGSGASQKMIGMWHQDRWSNGGAHGIGYAVSSGGAWQPQQVLPSTVCTTSAADPLHIYQRSSDPWVSFGPDGTAYSSVLSFNVTDNENAVVVGTMDKNKTTWRDVKAVDGSVFHTFQNSTDKNSTTADPLVAGTAYTVWDTLTLATDQPDDNPHTQAYTGPAYFSKTTDWGKNWSKAQIIIDTNNRQQTIGNIIVVDPTSGALYDFTDLIISPNTPRRGVFGNAQLAFVKSTDGGKTWTQPQLIAPFNSLGVHDPITGLPLRVGDGLEEVAISNTGKLFVVYESSTRFDKNINQSTGLWDDEIMLTTSPDGGRTWTGPAPIHDAGGQPTYTPTVAVNGNTLAVTYYDNRDRGSSTTVMPTDYWVSTFNATTLARIGEQHIAGPFDEMSAPVARGFFLGDYEGLQPSGSGFEALFVTTNCNGPSYNDPTVCGPAFYTGGPSTRTNQNPTDVFASFIS